MYFLANFSAKGSIRNRKEIMSSALWFNPEISNTMLFFPKWYNHGLIYVADLLADEGTILSQHDLEKKYSLK